MPEVPPGVGEWSSSSQGKRAAKALAALESSSIGAAGWICSPWHTASWSSIENGGIEYTRAEQSRAERQTDRKTDRQAGRQTDREADRQTASQKYKLSTDNDIEPD